MVEEPSGDWTMVPGEGGLTLLPRTPEKPPEDAKLPTGDWTIARVEDSPSGWSEPSKVDIAPLRANIRAHTGPPVPVISGEKPLEVTMSAKAFDIEEETKSGLKIEIDSSLPVERLTNTTSDASLASTQFAAPIVPELATPLPGTLRPMAMPRPLTQPSAASGSFPELSRAPNAQNLFETARINDATSEIDRGRKRRLIIIVMSAALAAIVGTVVVIAMTRGGDGTQANANVVPPPVTPAAAAAVTPPVAPDAALAVEDAPPPADAAEDKPVDDKAAVDTPASGDCVVDVQTTPAGVEIVLGKDVMGTTPAKVTLPCGVEAKLVLRKARHVSVTRAVTPSTGTKVRATLAKTMLSVKVTSSPPGATITLAGKSLGVTPAMIKLPAMEASTLVISKPGFSADTQRFTPKQNNQSVHVALKKKGR